MDYETFMAIINAVGIENVLGFIFDNSGRKLFKKGELTNITDIMPTDLPEGVMRFKEKDGRGNEYYVYKHINTLFTILTVDDPNTMNLIDPRFISS